MDLNFTEDGVNASFFNKSQETLEQATDEFYQTLVGRYRAYVSPTIACCGIVGNMLVLVVFATERQKSRFSIYCMWLALVHTVALLTNSLMDDFLGRGLSYLTNEKTYFKFDTQSDFMCKMMEFLPHVMYFVSSYIVVFFSIDRILTIFKPLQFHATFFIRGCFVICFVVFVIGFLISVPILLTYSLVINTDVVIGYHKCQVIDETSALSKFGLYLTVVITFIVPTFLVLVMNIVICVKFQRIRVYRLKLIPGDTRKNSQEMGRVVGHLAVGTAFLLVTFPLVVVMILRLQGSSEDSLKHLSRLFSSLKDINYSIDFFLYFTFLTNFRWRTLKMFFYFCLKRHSFQSRPFGRYLQQNLERYATKSQRQRKTIELWATKMTPKPSLYFQKYGKPPVVEYGRFANPSTHM